ncbi:tapasin-related protein isoform X2 [Erinaceus europaeus]|uniref:Tapasin-related protein n=1 Tax=Erinaceus europaeus TaxID=9365 RepID=A0A1S3WI04_ERIEU|nr:tapasin-related protein isoform X2 [Erinaceus europaeus]
MGAEEVWCLLFCWSLSAATEPAQGRWRPVDVVLDCFLVKEGRQQGALGGNRNTVKALLVLKQVPVLDEGGLEGFTDFQGQVSAEDEPPVTFEASVDLVRIEQAEALLHADCNEKQVTCELSRYFPQTQQEPEAHAVTWFIANVQVSGEGPGMSMVMKTLGKAGPGVALHPLLNLPLSPQGTVQMAVEFQVTTQTPSLTSLLKSAVTLHCSFSTASSEALTRVEWRLQHQGSGRLVSSWTVGQGQAGQKGASLEPQQLQTAGNASLTLASLTVKDEGAYICQITTSRYQAQQIVQLSVQALPKVKLSQASEALPSSLTCHVTGFYPLDMAVTWSRQEVGGAPTPVSDASFSSLRQNAAGTYSISSFLVAEPGSEGATYTCHVTHISLQEPLVASTQVAPPEQRTGFGILVASGLFLITLWLLVLQRQHATLPRSA